MVLKETPLFFFLILLLLWLPVKAQDTIPSIRVDSLYREDQFYIGLNYNLVTHAPNGVSVEGISGGWQLGFLRDMPINKQRNIAVALGLGVAVNQFGQNLQIKPHPTNDNSSEFVVLDSSVDYDANRFSMATIDLPFEFRWRTSTPTEYNFWRVYTGFRLGYAFWNKSRFKSNTGSFSYEDIPEFEKLRMGLTLSVGYGTFNFTAYYSLTPFFNNSTTTDGQNIEMRSVRIGLMFYIL